MLSNSGTYFLKPGLRTLNEFVIFKKLPWFTNINFQYILGKMGSNSLFSNYSHISSHIKAPSALTKKADKQFKLPTLHALLQKTLKSENPTPVKDTIIVYIHHPLKTSVTLLQSILDLGANPNDVFVLGKHYSECPTVVTEMKAMNVHYQDCSEQIGLGLFHRSFLYDLSELWSGVKKHIETHYQGQRKKIMVLDHGGHAVNTIPQVLLTNHDIIAIEKTTAGLVNINKEGIPPPFPVIGVANSITKRELESPLIARAIVSKLKAAGLMQFENEKLDCGVVGYGAVGKALTDMLISLGHNVTVYDIDPSKINHLQHAIATKDLNALVASSNYIFGCTGQDISTALDIFRLSKENKTLISCSSEDVEFLSLLKEVQRLQNGKVAKQPLNDVIYTTARNAIIKIVRGGFPANFDNSGESVPARDIDLTRSLVLAAVIQAAAMLNESKVLEKHGIYALSAQSQKFVADLWLGLNDHHRYKHSTLQNFRNLYWIQHNSGGIIYPSQEPSRKAQNDHHRFNVKKTPTNPLPRKSPTDFVMSSAISCSFFSSAGNKKQKSAPAPIAETKKKPKS